MEHWRYLDFDLKLTRTGDHYQAHVYNAPAGQASVDFHLPLSPLEIENLILRMTRLRSSNRAVDSPEVAAARMLGGKLFEAVFQGPVRDCLRASLARAQGQPETGLRIKLRLQDAPDLADLPWEFLYDAAQHSFLAQATDTPLVRFVELPHPVTPLGITPPLRILGMISSPSDYPELNTQREKEQVLRALEPLLQDGQVEIDWLEKATLNDLRLKLRTKPYHVFHFIGHGGFDRGRQQGILIFENEHGRSQPVSGEQLGILLKNFRSLRLAVLNACEGARNDPQDPFAGVAANLVLHRLPAVVAMQFEISDRAAIAFSADFYSVLAQGGAVDEAVSEARQAIYFLPNEIEWGTPVLFLHAPDGVLFDVQARPQPEGEQAGRTINTGVYIEGNVYTSGGDVAGQDKVQTAPRRSPEQPPAKPAVEPQRPPDRWTIGGMEFCRVPAGPFLIGSREDDPQADEDERPQRTLDLAYDYWLGRFPVTNAQFADFARQEKLEHPVSNWQKISDHPVVNVNWHTALRFCQWLNNQWAAQLPPGFRVMLPSEAEWEKAARGPEGNIWPWGKPFDRNRCNVEESKIGKTTPVGRYSPLGDSPYGCADMSGNVWEWTRSHFKPYPYDPADGREDLQAGDHVPRVLRGGSFDLGSRGARCSFRSGLIPFDWLINLGFRVGVAAPIHL